ncbi:MAG: xylulokinase [Chloroflexota bacterium]
MATYLGIDLGTSSVKALVVEDDGRVRGVGSAEFPTSHPQPGWSEQDPDDWWTAAAAAVRQAVGWLSGAGIEAIGLTGQMHGTVLLSEHGQPVMPAVIWSDTRSWRQAQQLNEHVGMEKLAEIAGSPVAAGFQAATLSWLKQERASMLWRAGKVLLPKDELRRRMTGETATDPGDASGALLLDVRWRSWSPDLLRQVGLDASRLPTILPSAARAGSLTAAAAEAFGLPAGTPVMTGTGDAAAGLLGAGIVDPGTMLLSISTGAQVMVPASAVHPDPKGRTHTFCSALEPGPGRPGWYTMGATLSAGMGLRWLRDEALGLTGSDAYERMTGWAAASRPGASGLIFLPYLAGERTPYMDARLRGSFLGLGAHHQRGDLVRAVIEGSTMAALDAFEVLREQGARPERIVMAGGGAKSPLWRQIAADLFGLPVHALATADQAAMGAALLAAAGASGADPVALAQRWAAYGPGIEPSAAVAPRYAQLFELFRKAREATTSISHDLVAFNERRADPVAAQRPRRRG